MDFLSQSVFFFILKFVLDCTQLLTFFPFPLADSAGTQSRGVGPTGSHRCHRRTGKDPVPWGELQHEWVCRLLAWGEAWNIGEIFFICSLLQHGNTFSIVPCYNHCGALGFYFPKNNLSQKTLVFFSSRITLRQGVMECPFIQKKFRCSFTLFP